MKRMLAGLGATAVAVAVYLGIKQPAQFIDTTRCYVNQAGVIVHLQSTPGKTYGTGSAHGVCIVGEDGVCYGLVDQCPISGPETRYQRPGINAGHLAQDWWDFYWVGPLANQNRCYMLPPGRIAPPVPVNIPPCGSTIPCVPHPIPATGSFNPVLFSCNLATPVPTSNGGLICQTVTPQTVCVTPTPHP